MPGRCIEVKDGGRSQSACNRWASSELTFRDSWIGTAYSPLPREPSFLGEPTSSVAMPMMSSGSNEIVI